MRTQSHSFRNNSRVAPKKNAALLMELEPVFTALNEFKEQVLYSKKPREYFGENPLRPDLESLWLKMREGEENYYLHKVISITSKLRFTLKSKYPQLSETELQIASLIWAGFTTPMMAEICILSENTVEKHRLHVREKLHIPKGSTIAGFLTNISGAS